jgi:hypothetical protein
MSTYSPMPPMVGAIRDEISRVRQQLQGYGVPDAQEMQERTDAAGAYAGEKPRHFVDYVEECVRTTSLALREVRGIQRQCWDVYQEKEPPNYAFKEPWQSQAILPKPYAAVQFAVAMVQAAFSPSFLSIRNEPDDSISTFWTKLMHRQLDEQHSNFVVRFMDASEMAFAVGQSLEMIPIWDSAKKCLTYSLVEPWKIYRDPDALNREPQSGLYWIHEEWNDYHVLREGEKQGQYMNTLGLMNSGQSENPMGGVSYNPLMQQTEQARLRNHVYKRNSFRHAILTREFWGTVLSPNGEMLLPSATYTVAGNRLISMPTPAPYSALRWPGVGFSPLPHLLRFEGRSLLQSVCSLWYLMCNLLSLHADYQNWIVNPLREINVHGLANQDDLEDLDPFPGRLYQTRDTVSGQQVVRNVDQRFISNDIMANEGWLDQVFQRGSMVNDVVQGLPGYRQDITAREQAQHLAQSRTVFSKMGANEDVGAVQAILAGMETIRLDATRETVLEAFSLLELLDLFGDRGDGQPTIFDDTMPSGVRLPPLQGTLHVSGLQTLLQENQELQTIEQLIVPMSTHPVFGAYIRPYNVVKAIEARANLEDEKLVVDEDTAEQLMQQQQQRSQQAQDAQQALLQAQIKAIEQKGVLDTHKAELAGQQQQLDTHQQALEMMQQQAEFQMQADASAQDRELAQANMAKIAADIAEVAQQLKMDEANTALEMMKVEGRLHQIAAGIALEHARLGLERERMDSQERIAAVHARGQQRSAE